MANTKLKETENDAPLLSYSVRGANRGFPRMQPRDNKHGIPEEAVAWFAPLAIIAVIALLGIPVVQQAIENGRMKAAEEAEPSGGSTASNEIKNANSP